MHECSQTGYGGQQRQESRDSTCVYVCGGLLQHKKRLAGQAGKHKKGGWPPRTSQIHASQISQTRPARPKQPNRPGTKEERKNITIPAAIEHSSAHNCTHTLSFSLSTVVDGSSCGCYARRVWLVWDKSNKVHTQGREGEGNVSRCAAVCGWRHPETRRRPFLRGVGLAIDLMRSDRID